MNQPVHDDSFRTELRRADCDTLISQTGKTGEWLISTSDGDFTKLKKKLSRRKEKTKPDFVDAVESFQDFSFEDKIGPILRENPLGRIEVNKIILSLIHKESDIQQEKLNSAVDLIESTAKEEGFVLRDKLITENVCLILLECNEIFLRKISNLDLIYKIDRPVQFELETDLSKDLPDVGSNIPPPKDAHGILVMDSGVKLHPLLRDAIPRPGGIVGLPDRDKRDDRIHGTAVAGIALHGDIRDKIQQKNFQSEVWIYSAKVFYQDGCQVMCDDDSLFANKIKSYVDEIIKKYPKCRIINMSFGDTANVMQYNSKQFDLAALVDDLSIQYKENDIIFVISTGNISQEFHLTNRYPNYLMDGNIGTNLMDPATSVHAFSVGALQSFGSMPNQPSTITRIGPGINGMVKPELVEEGGGFDGEIVVLNHDYQQRLFTIGMGTSYSAPKIAHYLARLFNRYPMNHRNLIKCLLLSSANFPPNRPKIFPKSNSQTKVPELKTLLNIYGYGKPDIANALNTSDDRVALKFEGSMDLNQVKYFTVALPDDFVNKRGSRHISISLVYDPPIKRTRADYFGVGMEFHLFKDVSLEDIQEKFNQVDLEYVENDVERGKTPEILKKYEIDLKPGIRIRKKTPHQHGKIKLSTNYKIENKHPLVLVVITQKKWQFLNSFMQDFALVVTIEHAKEIDLYNQIILKNNINVSTRISF